MTISPVFRVASSGDDFVGIRMDNGRISVSLPMGSSFPNTETHQKQSARNLIRVLREFRPLDKTTLTGGPDSAEAFNDAFPFKACVTLILDFLDTGEILSTEIIRKKVAGRGRIDWRQTFRKSVPYGLEHGELLYTQFITRQTARNLDADVSKIHSQCLDFAFQSIGWLITDVEYRSDANNLSNQFASSVVRAELQKTFNDRRRQMLNAMLEILEEVQSGKENRFFTYGTHHFELVWEKMIDRVFGALNKEDYFPRANWILESGNRTPAPLEIDSIMFCQNNAFVLDAKYYRYGITNNPFHLPGAADINKQITYGNMTAKKLQADVFNAFLLPYRSDPLRPGPFFVFGAGEPTWIEPPLRPHHYVVGVLVDTDSLIEHSLSPIVTWKIELSNAIARWHIDNPQ